MKSVKAPLEAAQRPVDTAHQKRALDALLATLRADYLSVPEHIARLIVPKAYGEQRSRESFDGRTGVTFDPDSAAEALAGYVLDLMLDSQRLNRLATQHRNDPDAISPSLLVNRLLDATVRQGDAQATLPRLAYLTLHKVMTASADPNLAPEVKGEMLFQVKRLHRWLNDNQQQGMHQMMAMYLSWFWEHGEWKGRFDVKPLPPGSPI